MIGPARETLLPQLLHGNVEAGNHLETPGNLAGRGRPRVGVVNHGPALQPRHGHGGRGEAADHAQELHQSRVAAGVEDFDGGWAGFGSSCDVVERACDDVIDAAMTSPKGEEGVASPKYWTYLGSGG